MSGELWCAVDYDGNALSHSNKKSKKLGSNQRNKKRVNSSNREVQGPSLGLDDYHQAMDNVVVDSLFKPDTAKNRKKTKKKLASIDSHYQRTMAAETGLNKKGKATKNSKDAHPLSVTATTTRQTLGYFPVT